MYRYESLVGPEIIPVLDDVARLRVELFRDYPYLYNGNLEYEKNYLKGLAGNEKSFVAAAYHGGEVVGAATALPLLSDAEILDGVRERFVRAGIEPAACYYYSEILVRPAHRRRGISSEFYRRRKEMALDIGFSVACFAALDTGDSGMTAPPDYFDPSGMWRRMGFSRHRDIHVDYHWPTLQPDGSTADMAHRLYFWTRRLEGGRNNREQSTFSE